MQKPPDLIRKKVKYIHPPVTPLKGERWTVLNLNSQTTYYISTHGRIFSTFMNALLKLGTVAGHSTFDWTVKPDMQVTIPKRWSKKTGNRERVTVQRLVAFTFIEQPTPDHDIVIHLNLAKKDNRVVNLRWIKPGELIDYSSNSPIWKWGRKNGIGLKLTKEDVVQIKKMLNPANRTLLVKDIARKYGVAEMQIYRIQNGELWSSVPGYKKVKEKSTKLNSEVVIKIKKMLIKGVAGVLVSKKMSIPTSTISRIKKGKYYKQIE